MAINVATMFRVSIFERFLPVGVMFGKLGVAAALAIGTGVYILQAVVSRLWLQRFLYGPVEWLWRSAMYGRRQPMWRT